MKSLIKSALVALVVASSTFAVAGVTSKEEVEVVPSKYKNLFVFKTEKKFIGADVEVFYSNGDKVTVQRLQKKKMIIDFCDAKFGTYTIRVKKGDNVQEFQYVKK